MLLEVASGSLSACSFWLPLRAAPFRRDRRRRPEGGTDQERFLGGRRKAAGRTVLKAEGTNASQRRGLLFHVAGRGGHHPGA